MLTKTITYTDFNGDEQKETLRFNYTKHELLKLNSHYPGGLSETAEELSKKAASNDLEGAKEIYDFVRSFVLEAYGVVSADGKRFIKDDNTVHEFSQSAAFEALVDELVTDGKALEAFVTGVLPAKLAQQIAQEQAKIDTQTK